MNRTMWARSPASAQRNPTRRWFTHSLLTALIVYPLPVLTLCYLFSQQVLKIKFPYLKLSLTHSKSYFKLGNLEKSSKRSCYSVYPLLIILSVKTHCHFATSLPSACGEFLKCSFKVWSVLNFYLIKGHPKRGEEPSPTAINKYRHQSWGIQGVRSSLLVTTHSSNLLVQHN